MSRALINSERAAEMERERLCSVLSAEKMLPQCVCVTDVSFSISTTLTPWTNHCRNSLFPLYVHVSVCATCFTCLTDFDWTHNFPRLSGSVCLLRAGNCSVFVCVWWGLMCEHGFYILEGTKCPHKDRNIWEFWPWAPSRKTFFSPTYYNYFFELLSLRLGLDLSVV